VTWRGSRAVATAAALLIIALAVRIAEVQSTSYRPINDAGTYLTLASSVAHTGGYWNSTVRGGAGGTRGPTAYFPPAFPYFLAGVDLLDGHASKRGPAIHPARLSQAVIGTIAVGLIGLVALEAFGATVALIALAIAAVYPVLIELSGTLVAENLLTVFILLAVWAALRARRGRRSFAWTAAAGLFAGLAVLTHQNAAVIVVPLVIAVWTGRPRWTLRALEPPIMLLAVTVITVSPWTIRNSEELHRVIPVSDEIGITLAGTYNSVSAADTQIPYKWHLYYSFPEDRGLVRNRHRLTETELSDRLTTQAFNYIDAHPVSPLAAAYHNSLRLLELEGSFAWHASAAAVNLPTSTAQVGVISFWILCLIAIAGAFTRIARRAPRWLWAVPLLIAISVVLVNAETPRFREPIDPFLILLAACAIATVVDRLRGSPVRRDLDAAPATGGAEPVKVIQRLA
jgi:4-amino-4-deoxy-L-arabinose transferase-like glycosyltransferase